MEAPEPVLDIAHLGHVELLTPKPEESLRFFRDVMGMSVSGQEGDSVFLRGWDDYERFSLQLTAAAQPGLAEAPSDGYVSDFLASRESVELNKAYSRITDMRTRRAILELVRSLAPEEAETMSGSGR